MSEGRFDEAAAVYADMVKSLPGNAGLLLNLGLAEEMGGHPDRAIAHLQSVLKSQPASVPALTSLAMAQLQLNQPAAALPNLRKLHNLNPRDINAIGMLAGAEFSLHQLPEAAAHYESLTSLASADPKAWYGLGQAYEERAAQSFNRLSKLDNQSGYVALLLAEARLQQGQYRSAFFFYEEASRRTPGLPGLHSGLARVYEKTGHTDWAATERTREASAPCGPANGPACQFTGGSFRAAVKSAGSDAPGLFWQARAYNALANQAFAQLNRLPESIEVHAVKAQMMHGHGQDGEAAKEWQAALALAPDKNDPRLKAELASALFQAHNYNAAIPALRELLATDPESPDYNFMLGESLWRSQQPDAAAPLLEKAVTNRPDLLPAHAALGLTLAALGRNEAAIPHLERSLELDDEGSLHYSLARAYQATGNTEKAKANLAAYQKIQATNKETNETVATQSEITPPR